MHAIYRMTVWLFRKPVRQADDGQEIFVASFASTAAAKAWIVQHIATGDFGPADYYLVTGGTIVEATDL